MTVSRIYLLTSGVKGGQLELPGCQCAAGQGYPVKIKSGCVTGTVDAGGESDLVCVTRGNRVWRWHEVLKGIVLPPWSPGLLALGRSLSCHENTKAACGKAPVGSNWAFPPTASIIWPAMYMTHVGGRPSSPRWAFR